MPCDIRRDVEYRWRCRLRSRYGPAGGVGTGWGIGVIMRHGRHRSLSDRGDQKGGRQAHVSGLGLVQ
jgi:hypothetical protein